MEGMIKIIKKLMCFCVAFSVISSSAAYADAPRVYVNGMRVAGNIIVSDNTTYVPLRTVGESLGANVIWDSVSNSVYVTLSEDDAISHLVAEVSPSIVTIIGNYNNTGEENRYNNPTMHGTGVIYKSNGHIVTNAHVVKDIKNLTVVLSNGELLPGKVLYSDEKADIAIVKIDKLGLKPITMANPDEVVSGRTAIAIGTPISLSMRNSVTKGIVSGANVSLKDSYYKLIQTDAAINPGNSGGPLLNIKGELIGINSSKFASVNIDSMGFAIPVDTVCHAISQFEAYGKIMRPELDFTLQQSWEADIGLPTTKGITVKNSSNPYLASQDIITSVNGIPVHSITDWNEALKVSYNGKDILVTHIRNGQTLQSVLTL